jgi:hypothetical protein
MHPACSAEAHLAFGVEAVVAQSVVLLGLCAGGSGLGGGAIGVARGVAAHRAVGALLVVVLAELVELALQLDAAVGERSGVQPALERLVEAFDLALCLGVAGGAVLLTDPEHGQEVFEGVAPVKREV